MGLGWAIVGLNENQNKLPWQPPTNQNSSPEPVRPSCYTRRRSLIPYFSFFSFSPSPLITAIATPALLHSLRTMAIQFKSIDLWSLSMRRQWFPSITTPLKDTLENHRVANFEREGTIRALLYTEMLTE